MNNRVTVVGSYNVGLFLKGEAIPKGGETLIGQTFYESGGGQGLQSGRWPPRRWAPKPFSSAGLGRDRVWAGRPCHV